MFVSNFHDLLNFVLEIQEQVFLWLEKAGDGMLHFLTHFCSPSSVQISRAQKLESQSCLLDVGIWFLGEGR